ncbi:hypothetical protein [Dyadobacter arcticus]|uniref:FtsH-binding integral membrane protein n=1 Tax=Dyadobacter arcticus TaxID=1078754 RepID=A0ABX0UTA2_9BACT|nr:hypothetical protein [Dyadobacter arcticus]NIJ55005.1 FtsH-binding integral membrane protein [Dyadobacter arcticus]
MFWFTAALSVNIIAILLIIANSLYDALTLQHGTSHNDIINLIGAVLVVVVVIAFSLKSAGKIGAANILLWIPAAPLVVCLAFTLVYIGVIIATKPDWK